MITIIGAEGNISQVDEILRHMTEYAEQRHITMQALNADIIFGKDHLLSATRHALRAFEQHTNATNSLAMEILLYASGERQIQRAIPKLGISAGPARIAFVMVSDIQHLDEAKGTFSASFLSSFLATLNLKQNDKVLEGDRHTLERFGITPKEIHTVPETKFQDLILEKVAMVDVIK